MALSGKQNVLNDENPCYELDFETLCKRLKEYKEQKNSNQVGIPGASKLLTTTPDSKYKCETEKANTNTSVSKSATAFVDVDLTVQQHNNTLDATAVYLNLNDGAQYSAKYLKSTSLQCENQFLSSATASTSNVADADEDISSFNNAKSSSAISKELTTSTNKQKGSFYMYNDESSVSDDFSEADDYSFGKTIASTPLSINKRTKTYRTNMNELSTSFSEERERQLKYIRKRQQEPTEMLGIEDADSRNEDGGVFIRCFECMVACCCTIS